MYVQPDTRTCSCKGDDCMLNRKVAFAFGCSDAEGIRLHYGAAKTSRDRRSGAIRRTDNSVGDRVEIIIGDLKSYIPAMHYVCFQQARRDYYIWDDQQLL